MEKYFARYEPHLVGVRKARRLQRRRFWAAGVNDICQEPYFTSHNHSHTLTY